MWDGGGGGGCKAGALGALLEALEQHRSQGRLCERAARALVVLSFARYDAARSLVPARRMVRWHKGWAGARGEVVTYGDTASVRAGAASRCCVDVQPYVDGKQ